MDGTGNHHFEQNKPSLKSQTSHVFCSCVKSRSKMATTIMKMGHECKMGTWGWCMGSVGGGGR
jgi:hypothetical protein